MKHSLLTLAGALAIGLLASCNDKQADAVDQPDLPTTPPPPPSAEVIAALEAQPAGKKLLGKTHLLIGDKFVKSDPQAAPDYYLIHYSFST